MFGLSDTQKQLRDAARKLAEKVIQPRAAEIDRTEEYPWDNVRALTKAGFMGLTSAVPGCEAEDVNTDGTVNVLDLIDLLLAFGTACP